MQLLSRRRSGPLRVRDSSARMLFENCKGGQQRLEDHDYWLRLLAAYSALTGELKVGDWVKDVCRKESRDPVHQPQLLQTRVNTEAWWRVVQM